MIESSPTSDPFAHEHERERQESTPQGETSRGILFVLGVFIAFLGGIIVGDPSDVGASLRRALPGVEGWAAVVLAVLAYHQWLVAKSQRDIAARQVRWMKRADERTEAQLRLMRQEFLATHRPELVIRSLWMTEVTEPEEVEVALTENLLTSYKFTFWIVNKGRSPATLVALRTTTFTGLTHFPTGRNSLLANPLAPWIPNNVVIAPGASLQHDVSGHISEVRMAAIDMGMDQRTDAYFLGRLVYKDDAGTRREVGFCRRYNLKTGESEIVNDPAVEYSD